MGKPKKNKNNPDNKEKQKVKIVTSFECEKCGTKCDKGINYLKRFENNAKLVVGYGVACKI